MKVTVFSTTKCPYCSLVKTYLSKKGVQYSEINIEKNPKEAMRAQKLSGALTVPITLIEKDANQSVIVGWNPAKLATI